MEIQTLSSFPGVPFNDTFETFSDSHTLNEDVECYQLLFCPYGTGSSFEDLYKINFQSRVVVLNMMDLMIDNNDNTATEELKKFCESYPEHNFIVFNLHPGLQHELKVSNLYLDSIIATNFTENLNHCEKKEISNRWLSLNRDTKVHRVLTVSYLLSKDYYLNGDITFDMEASTLVTPDKYKNITTGLSSELKKDLARGFARFKAKDFNRLNIRNFDKATDRVATNHNQNLLPLYQTTGVEIITGTMFFEKSPVFSEKEIQPVYGKNFPIYINGVGIVREMKNLFGVDTFDDIIDNSYDEIEDHFERLAAAIDRNEHLLNGSTNIHELWSDNRQRFEDNCKKVDSMFFDRSYQRTFNHEKIKQSLKYFNVSCLKK